MDEVLKVLDRLIGYDPETRGIYTYETGNGRSLDDVINDIDYVKNYIKKEGQK